MHSSQIRKKFLDFFQKKGHKIMPSSSLLPKDPTVLFTSAGMQQFLPYLSGEKDPVKDFGQRHLASCQKCFRTDDIDEVGDDTHHTLFEMLGNWSIGQDPKTGYFKEGTIRYALEFFVDELGLKKENIWTTIFKGEGSIPRDKEAFQTWQKNGIPKKRIREFGMEENFWGPVGGKIGPCGPSSEIFYDKGERFGCKNQDCGPNCPNCNRFFELWNLVFMEYHKEGDGRFKKLPQKNIDTGIGFERLVAVLQNKPSVYETDLILPIYQSIENSITSKEEPFPKRLLRILCDHLRANAFLISEGVLPSNVDRGYILRRLLRRCTRYARSLRLKKNWYIEPVKEAVKIYGKVYSEIKTNEEKIITVIQNEEEKFGKTLEQGLKILRKEIKRFEEKSGILSGLHFLLYESYGFPPEMTLEEIKRHIKDFTEENEKEYWEIFNRKLEKHQEISRVDDDKKFKGGLVEQNYETIKLHTATHLLLQALREVLGNHIYQKGSSITSERLRLDFSHPEKLTEDQIKKVEDLVNQKIKEDLPVTFKEMTLEEAKIEGAIGVFEERYGDKVKVYKIGNFSREICGGPHIKNTGELGQFKIQKEESIGKDIIRIKAVLS